MTTRKTVKARRPRRPESPRYQFRITPAQDERLCRMGTVERRKFVRFMREKFTGLFDEWDSLVASQPCCSPVAQERKNA